MILQKPQVVTVYDIEGQSITDQHLTGTFGFSGTLQISGLSVALAQVGQPVQVIFTASNTATRFEVVNACDTISGLIATQDGIVVAKLSGQQVCVGPYGTALGNGQSAFVSLTSVGALPAQYAGVDLAGATVSAYVGSHFDFDAYRVGDQFASNLNVMLQTSVVVTGSAAPFPGSGGGNPPPPTGGGGTPPPPTGGGSGSHSTTLSGLTTTEKVIAGVAVVVVAGGIYWMVAK